MRLRMFNQRWTSIRVLGILIYRPLLFLRFPVVVWYVFRLIFADKRELTRPGPDLHTAVV